MSRSLFIPTMLDTLISSKTRIKLLLRLFLNPGNSAHLRGLADDFGESTNSVRLELNRFEEAQMITSKTIGNKKLYSANNTHPLFREINTILRKYVGLDRIIDTVFDKMGDLNQVFLEGDYAAGRDSGVIDLVFIGDVNKSYLVELIDKAEKLIEKKIKYIIYNQVEWGREQQRASHKDALLLWEKA